MVNVNVMLILDLRNFIVLPTLATETVKKELVGSIPDNLVTSSRLPGQMRPIVTDVPWSVCV